MKHASEFLALVNDAKSRIEEIDLNGYRKLLAAGMPHVLIDTREESEWAAGHAAGAVHLGKGIIERDIEKAVPDVDTEIVLYCGGGFRSALAAEMLGKMGYRNVKSMAGGWRGWKAKSLPTE